MFSKIALFFAASMAVFAVALPSPGGPEGSTTTCNNGGVYCCNQLQDAKSAAAQKEIGLLAAAIPIAGNVGLTCSPATIVGISKNTCTSQAACCSGNNFNGAVVVGCSPLNAGIA